MNNVEKYLQQARIILKVPDGTTSSQVIELAKMLQIESAFELSMKMHPAPKEEIS